MSSSLLRQPLSLALRPLLGNAQLRRHYAFSSDVKTALRKAQCVCFDVDSTVIQDEGIDVLAAFKGKGDEVARLTAQ
jgi:hypothetical protein